MERVVLLIVMYGVSEMNVTVADLQIGNKVHIGQPSMHIVGAVLLKFEM